MKEKARRIKTDNESVVFFEGVFYDEHNRPVFAPENNYEFRLFVDRIDEEEKKAGKGKKLKKKDIETIVDEVKRARGQSNLKS